MTCGYVAAMAAGTARAHDDPALQAPASFTPVGSATMVGKATPDTPTGNYSPVGRAVMIGIAP
ncbi:MAG: hypothetical protein KGI37_09385 [Alphaproteobacteria bacterium]|nr:hypothetical protein [Alphaproteobacteria bacterium]